MKLAVIVGGSAGLGLVLAQSLAKRGTQRIVLVARNADRLHAAATKLKAQFPHTDFKYCAADMGTVEGAQLLSTSVAESSLQVDLLVNAIGLSDRGTLAGLKVERLAELWKANIVGPLLATQAIVPLMQPGSTIVNIGSLSSLFAPSYLGGYSIVKHGLRALTQQLRMELRSQGIHVMLACPGPIAREDTGSRYSHLEAATDIPKEALQGGGGAKIKELKPQQLAEDVLQAVDRRQSEIIRPRKARLLLILMSISPRLGEWILRKKTS